MFDLAIIGGGPGGVSAGVYAARKRLKTVFITDTFGGQSIVSSGIQNWIGTIEISGENLAENLKKHLEAYASDIITIAQGELVQKIDKKDGGFSIETKSGKKFDAKTVLITSGSHRRKLEAKGAEIFEHKGITYCATCDGPLFAGKDVVVVGGGNAAFETAVQLAAYCQSVTLLNRSGDFRADPVTVEKVLSNPKIKAIKNSKIVEIKGDKFVTGITYQVDGEAPVEMPAQGVFVEIGLIPTTEYVAHLTALDKWGHIVTDPRTQRTSIPGIWAAGDCTDGLYHQNNIAAGDAVKALEDIYLSLHTQ